MGAAVAIIGLVSATISNPNLADKIYGIDPPKEPTPDIIDVEAQEAAAKAASDAASREELERISQGVTRSKNILTSSDGLLKPTTDNNSIL